MRTPVQWIPVAIRSKVPRTIILDRIVFSRSGCVMSQKLIAPNSGAPVRKYGGSIASLSPIRLAGGEKKVDAFADEGRHVLSEDLGLVSHQGAHHDREQNEVHENLRRSHASFRTKGSARRPRRPLGDVGQLTRHDFGGSIQCGVMNLPGS